MILISQFYQIVIQVVVSLLAIHTRHCDNEKRMTSEGYKRYSYRELISQFA